MGCKRFRTKRIRISTLRKVTVSTVLVGNATYITGVCFTSIEGLEVGLGYTAGGDESSLSITEHFMNTTSLTGFILAVGSRGIQALRLITCGRRLSQWLGCPDGLCQTRRLATFKSPVALKAGLDVSVASF